MSKADIEKICFYCLCGNELAEKTALGSEMTYEDFDKTVYILMELQFYDLLVEVWNEYYERFSLDIEGSNGMIENMEEEAEKYELWLNEFCGNVPTLDMRKILKEIWGLL